MFKLLILAVCATVSLAQQNPMPLMFTDFEATSYHFMWDNTRISPLNTWST